MIANTTPGVEKDLRLVYLLSFDNFATDPVEVNSRYPHINTRYARELLGILFNAGLLVLTEDNLGGNQMWQVTQGGSTFDRAEAEAMIDAWIAANTNSRPAPAKGSADRSSKPVHPATHPCLCGCGVLVGRNSNYRPGHDARHVSQVVAAVLAKPKMSAAQHKRLITALPTLALQVKAENAIDRKVGR